MDNSVCAVYEVATFKGFLKMKNEEIMDIEKYVSEKPNGYLLAQTSCFINDFMGDLIDDFKPVYIVNCTTEGFQTSGFKDGDRVFILQSMCEPIFKEKWFTDLINSCHVIVYAIHDYPDPTIAWISPNAKEEKVNEFIKHVEWLVISDNSYSGTHTAINKEKEAIKDGIKFLKEIDLDRIQGMCEFIKGEFHGMHEVLNHLVKTYPENQDLKHQRGLINALSSAAYTSVEELCDPQEFAEMLDGLESENSKP